MHARNYLLSYVKAVVLNYLNPVLFFMSVSTVEEHDEHALYVWSLHSLTTSIYVQCSFCLWSVNLYYKVYFLINLSLITYKWVSSMNCGGWAACYSLLEFLCMAFDGVIFNRMSEGDAIIFLMKSYRTFLVSLLGKLDVLFFTRPEYLHQKIVVGKIVLSYTFLPQAITGNHEHSRIFAFIVNN